MIKHKAAKLTSLTPKRVALSVGLALSVMGSGAANAFSFDTGNSDVEMRWDNQIRYNAGWRIGQPNPHFYNNPGTDETDLTFKRGDMVINRLDVFSEFDFAYKKSSGFRISAAVWDDWAYSDKKTVSNASFAATPNYRNNDFNAYAKRFAAGPSGEVLDAFVYGGWNFGGSSLQVKLGQHNVYWGESMFSPTNGISYSQGAVDTMKAAVSPGAEAKELFMPTQQISGQLSVNDELSVIAQYAFDWRPFRLVPGGTYFATSDAARADFAAFAAAPIGGIPWGGDIVPDKKRGDMGLGVRWSPEWVGGTVGAYYRKFDEKLPWSVMTANMVALAPGIVIAFPRAVRFNYARDTELFGLSLNKPVGPISFGAELVYRKNTGLNSTGITAITVAGAEPTYEQAEGARGNTWHVLLNGAYILPKTALWDTGSVAMELAYQKLDKITKNPTRYYGEGTISGGLTAGGINANCVQTLTGAGASLVQIRDHRNGCATNSALAMNVAFTPQWPQAFPGWDLSMPTSLAWGLKGNGPALGGTFEGQYSWSLGLQADYQYRHTFAVKYIQPAHTNYLVNPATNLAAVQNGASNGGGVLNNHGWLSFLYKTAF